MMSSARMPFRAFAAALCGTAALLLCSAGLADESEQTVRLKYRENAYLAPLTQFPGNKDVRFKKEPEFGSDKIYRTALSMTDRSKEFLGMIWDETTRKLYIDLNQNLDLTDDTPVSPRMEGAAPMTLLKDVRFQLQNPARSYQLDLELYSYRDTPFCTAEVRSGWEGQVRVGGETWTLAVIANLDGVLDTNDRILFYRNRDYTPKAGLLHQLYGERALPEFYVGDKRYRMKYSYEPAGAQCDVVVKLQESAVPTVPLEIAGAYIERIKLNGPQTVALDAPHGVVNVPAGAYTIQEVYVYDPASGRCFLSKMDRDLNVAAATPATLKAGAPLDNRMQLSRSGSALTLDYELAGIGGETYKAVSESSDALGRVATAPSFAVYKDGVKIASGTFEYG